MTSQRARRKDNFRTENSVSSVVNSSFFMMCICLLSLGGLLSCGLEAFYYIDYIPPSDYADTRSTISLPSGSSEGYGGAASWFTNFIIFYRIYISGEYINTGPYLRDSSVDRSTINSTLNSDYNILNPYTDINSTTVNTSNLENTFSNRKFFLLTLEGADINDVLGSGSLGGSLVIAFPPNPGEKPTLTINGGTPYILQRAVENQNLNLYNLSALPNRNFLNHYDLYTNANVNATNGTNIDTVIYSGSRTPLYTYVSMYIAARGTSLEMPPRTIYSQPTFIGIFRLANSG